MKALAIVLIAPCVLGTLVCPPGQGPHNSQTGVSKCCVPLTCPAGSEAVLCGDQDPIATCRTCPVGTYMPESTRSTQMRPCIIHTICAQSHGFTVRFAGTSTRDTECGCLDDLCPSGDICEPCRESHDDVDSTVSHEVTTVGDEKANSGKSKMSGWGITLIVIALVAGVVVVAIFVTRYIKRRRHEPGNQPDDGAELEHLRVPVQECGH